MCACVRACVRVCVRACVRVCVCVCVAIVPSGQDEEEGVLDPGVAGHRRLAAEHPRDCRGPADAGPRARRGRAGDRGRDPGPGGTEQAGHRLHGQPQRQEEERGESGIVVAVVVGIVMVAAVVVIFLLRPATSMTGGRQRRVRRCCCCCYRYNDGGSGRGSLAASFFYAQLHPRSVPCRT